MDLNRIFMKNASPTKVGGQAVIEGLMMRGSKALALALREPNGDIYLQVEPIKAPGKWKKIPVVRGIVSFISSLATGVGILLDSADTLEKLEKVQGVGEGGSHAEEPDAFEKWVGKHFNEKQATAIITVASVLLSLALTIGMFIILPTFLLGLVEKIGLKNVVALNLLEGLIRILIFVGYCLAISLMPEIKRVFQFHGAEHKTIHCYENKLELTPENAQSFYTLHPRCGTSFMMFVMIISLLVFSFLGWPGAVQRIVSRLVFLPLIAGLSYELLQFTGRHDGKIVQFLSLPGIALQKLTTKEPDLKQLEVAIAAMNAVLPSQENPDLDVEYFVGDIHNGVIIKNEEATKEFIAKKTKK